MPDIFLPQRWIRDWKKFLTLTAPACWHRIDPYNRLVIDSNEWHFPTVQSKFNPCYTLESFVCIPNIQWHGHHSLVKASHKPCLNSIRALCECFTDITCYPSFNIVKCNLLCIAAWIRSFLVGVWRHSGLLSYLKGKLNNYK